MIRSVVLALLSCSGCFLFPERDPQLQVTSPIGGTLVTNHEPIQIFLQADDIELADVRLTVDGQPVSSITVSPAANGQFCESCELRVTWAGFEAKEGLRAIGIEAIDTSGAVAADTLDLIFQDTPEIVRVTPGKGADLAGFGSVTVQVDVIERGTATMTLDIDGEQATIRDSNECNRADGCPLTFTWDTSTLPAGEHELHITVSDDRGNTVEDTRTVTVDDVVQVTSLGVSGLVDEDTATLEMEVYAFDADTNAFLGCAGSRHGLATVDVSGQVYEVDAVLVRAGSSIDAPVFLRGSDLATRNIRFEVWEDDDIPTCPSALEPTGNDLAGKSPAKSFADWQATTEPLAFGNVTELGVRIGRPRIQ